MTRARRGVAVLAVLVAGAAVGGGAGLAHADKPARRQLRVCADPNNLPFSNAKKEGLENAVARLVARALDAELTYTWLPQRRGFVRNTLAAGRCDVMMEAPAGYGRATTTRPYYRSTYVMVYRKDRKLAPRSLDDPALRTLRIGLQTIGDDYANTPPAAALGRRGLSRNVVGYPVYGDYSTATPQAPILDAVVAGTIDVAIVWGPLGGWFAEHARVPLTVVPLASGAADPPFAFAIGMGVRRGDEPLRRELDGVIASHRGELEALLRRYAVPEVASR
jgi:quinoprotein dehydrogenase-associated probable ABC transporter substrate-binding protein